MAKDDKDIDDFINNLEKSFRNMKPEPSTESSHPFITFNKTLNNLVEFQNKKNNTIKCLVNFGAKALIAITCIISVMFLIKTNNFNLKNAWFPITICFGCLATIGS
jgi:hypothetical protein